MKSFKRLRRAKAKAAVSCSSRQARSQISAPAICVRSSEPSLEGLGGPAEINSFCISTRVRKPYELMDPLLDVLLSNAKTRVPPKKLPFALRRSTPGMFACVLRTGCDDKLRKEHIQRYTFAGVHTLLAVLLLLSFLLLLAFLLLGAVMLMLSSLCCLFLA